MQPSLQQIVPSCVIPTQVVAATPNFIPPLRMMIVNSDSMKPTLNIGDQILYDTSVTKVQGDGLYLFRSLDVVVIRRVSVDPVRRLWKVSCDNPAYHGESNLPDDGEGYEVAGRVEWMGRRV